MKKSQVRDTMNSSATESGGLTEQTQRYYDQAPEEDKHEDRIEDIEAQKPNSSTMGYISIKDYAYEISNPLHFGYYEDTGTSPLDEDDQMSDGDLYDHDIATDHDKRQSIILPRDYVINQLAVALYDFEPENDNELGLIEGDIVFISYRHGQGWLVAENQERTKTGLVPEEFVTYLADDDEAGNGYHENSDGVETARPFYLTHLITQGIQTPSASKEQDHQDSGSNGALNTKDTSREDNDEWEDIDQLKEEIADKLNISDK